MQIASSYHMSPGLVNKLFFFLANQVGIAGLTVIGMAFCEMVRLASTTRKT